MEIGIAIFLGVWVMLGGIVSTIAVFKSFSKLEKENKQ